MKTSEFRSFTSFFSLWVSFAAALVLITVAFGCGDEAAQPTIAPTSTPLTCIDCEQVDVLDVLDANTLDTSIGEIQMYGAYVLDQPADCASDAMASLTELAGRTIRVEAGPTDSVRKSDNHFYMYTEDGTSIEEMLIREGLALVWSQDGQHLGWFIFLDAEAKAQEAGCLWHDYQAFQRGEPNEFRIPGLTYPDSN